MSRTADKKANRAMLKANWNSMPPRVPVEPPKTSSWWASAAAPSDDAKFTELARERDRHAWSNVVPHAMNPRGEFV